MFMPTDRIVFLSRQVREWVRSMFVGQVGLERFYDSVHHENEFDHGSMFSVYDRISSLEGEIGFDAETRSAVGSSEGSISLLLRTLDVAVGVDPAQTSAGSPLERPNHLETRVVGYTAAKVSSLRPTFVDCRSDSGSYKINT